MESFDFPNMLSSTNTKIISNHEATLSNLKLALLSSKRTLFGDPYFGTNLKWLLFEQGNDVLKDIVIDDVYTTILVYLPQLTLKRDDIDIIIDREKVYIKIKATNLLDFQTDLYTLNLMELQEG